MSQQPDPGSPASYPRRIVLASLGLAPQVLTETLYRLGTAAPPFVPTEIHVVTTEEGRHRARLTLLDDSTAMPVESSFPNAWVCSRICRPPVRAHFPMKKGLKQRDEGNAYSQRGVRAHSLMKKGLKLKVFDGTRIASSSSRCALMLLTPG
jgi:hypothetical protein